MNNHDKKMLKDGVISRNAFNARRKTNVITLSGQVISFYVNVVGTIAGSILSIAGLDNSFPRRILFRCFGIMIVSLSQLLTSPEMRRYLRIDESFNNFVDH